jgi:hypothetical protein
MANSKRRPTTPQTETDALARSRHRCALCYGIHRDSTVKQGQLAHVDQNAAHSDYENLVFLCLPHHDQYDSRTSQSKNFSQGEVRRYRGELDAYLKGLSDTKAAAIPWPDFGASGEPAVSAQRPKVVASPEVYDRKIAVYRALRTFLITAVKGATVGLQDLGRFAEDTDEALFLLGPEVSDYLRQVYVKGVRLYYTSNRIRDERLSPQADYSEVVHENADVLNWLSAQLEACRTVFAKVLLLE